MASTSNRTLQVVARDEVGKLLIYLWYEFFKQLRQKYPETGEP
jgi:hypothetical protein